ncbi:8-amino-7-oxononanoate synthase [Micromonospora matsumotoense]|uniref:8-amino-7-oxononanoate synthase n=1 Tax=Micromonospora matsumotoense TaxID=121616 RepID=A0A1C4UZJ7_9ACTN|nr:bifunctional SDR family oxidoreductase/pyridoxal phosphate-dependent aminotransferase family protein [Micromonospora matsumotoense]SCE77066.1 8-amino-7-oxononanoate synthase [Micromonospora matsumotoense]
MSAPRTPLAADHPVLRDHRIGGTPVLPAAAQLDAMLTACAAAHEGGSWRLDQVAFLAPLPVAPGGSVEIETVLTPAGECTLASWQPDGSGPVLHSRARATRSALTPPSYRDVAGLRAGCVDEVPLSTVAEWRRDSGIAYGPTFQAIRAAHRGPDRMLAVLRASGGLTERHFVPPPLLDSVFQCLGMLDDGTAGACLPWYVGRITARRPVTGTVLALVERTDPPGGAGGAVRGRATVCNQQGEVLVELDRIVLKAAGPTTASHKRPPSRQPTTHPADPTPAGTRSADPTPTGPCPADQPAAGPVPAGPVPAGPVPAGPVPAGSVTTVAWRPVVPTPEPATDPGRTWVVSGEAGVESYEGGPVLLTPADLHDAHLDRTRAGTPPAEVVYVAPRAVRDRTEAVALLHGVFTLVRRLAAQPPMPALTIVTSAAQQVSGDESIEPGQAALWGLARTLRIEHPQARVRLVDIGLGGGAEPPTLDEVRLGEAELAWRDGSWYAPTHPAVPVVPGRSARPVAGGRFLVTGGLGGIGLHVAEFLAGAGGAHLTLVGRTAPTEGPTRDRLDRLAATCDLRVVAADVRTLPDVLRGAEPFDGVFHAAGVLRDGLARSLSAERIDEVFGPKIGGVHALDEAFPADARPGFVVLFSSVSATHGNLGQSSYATANAYLDGYAARRRAGGEAWYSLGWGLWRVGMGAGIADAAAARGIPALTVADGIALLRHTLELAPANYVVSAVDEPEDDQMTPVTPVETRLWPVLSAILKRTLHVDRVSPDDNLLELGLDSMMAVEVSAALAGAGLDVDPVAMFDHPDVGALVRHLEGLPRHTPTPDIPIPSAVTPTAPSFAVPAVPGAGRSGSAAVPAGSPAGPAAARPAGALPDPVAASATPRFVPDWDRYRDVDGAADRPPPRPDHRAEAGRAAGRPAANGPRPTVGPAANGHRPTVGPPIGRERAAGPPGVAVPAGASVPRRTLPGRLGDHPGGSFLDRRIDALSVDDRVVIAQDDYFYEPVIEDSKGAWIKFDGRWFLNFASYSYLGLIGHDYINHQAQRALERHGTGAHGVRLLAGTLHLHRELELGIARFLGAEDAIVYTSGYMANVATIGALVGPGDVVIGDVYNHASILDGYRLSGATVITYAHNDLTDLERALRRAGDAGKLVVTDAVFSMDGDIADLPGILALCERYDAPLMVDEAHSLGVLGATGRGITEHFGIDPARVAVKMGTLSKTVPSTGGYVAGSSDLVFALKNNARGWMFSAAGTPMQVAAARAAVEVMEAAPQLTGELRALTDRYRATLRGLGFDTLASETPVVPIICASAGQAQEMARLCQADGIFVQPIVYPTVPKALPRLRTIVNLSHCADDLDHAVAVFTRAGRQVGLIA